MIIITKNSSVMLIVDLIFIDSNTINLNSNTKQAKILKILIIVDFIGFFNKKLIFKTLTQYINFFCVREIINCVRDLKKFKLFLKNKKIKHMFKKCLFY